MKIEWNRVTWYSKILALVLFFLLPILGFCFGIYYQQSMNEVSVITATSQDKQIKQETQKTTTNNTKVDCGKETFIVIAGPPHSMETNDKARNYFQTNQFTIDEESGSRFVVKPPATNTKKYWMEKVYTDGIGTTSFDNIGCDFQN